MDSGQHGFDVKNTQSLVTRDLHVTCGTPPIPFLRIYLVQYRKKADVQTPRPLQGSARNGIPDATLQKKANLKTKSERWGFCTDREITVFILFFLVLVNPPVWALEKRSVVF